MAFTTLLFDLDGTLLPMDQEAYTGAYCKSLAKAVAAGGYDPDLFLKTLWQGVEAMIKNDGSQTNEEAFWQVFQGVFGPKIREDGPLFDAYYEKEYPKLRPTCGYEPEAEGCIRNLKEQGFRLILATNPIFPLSATKQRITWAGLNPDDFELVTAYEASRHCKPNPDYYREILAKTGLTPHQCLMVGNDAEEDMWAAKEAGIDGFLLTKGLLNRKNYDISALPQGDFKDLEAFVSSR